jgi:hypothetical protein
MIDSDRLVGFDINKPYDASILYRSAGVTFAPFPAKIPFEKMGFRSRIDMKRSRWSRGLASISFSMSKNGLPDLNYFSNIRSFRTEMVACKLRRGICVRID